MSIEINTAVTPQGGFQWRDESGFEVVATNYNVFLSKIKARKLVTGSYVGGDWIDEIAAYVCAHQPVTCKDTGRHEQTPGQLLQNAEHFGHTLVRWVEGGGGFVPQEEAERRAKICSTCEKNKPMGGFCGGCAQIVSWIAKIATGKKTSVDHLLSTCQTCGCACATAVHFPLEAQHDDRFKPSDFAPGCWKA